MGSNTSPSKMVHEIFAITEDLLKHKEMHAAFKAGKNTCLLAHRVSNKKGGNKHEDGQRLIMARAVNQSIMPPGLFSCIYLPSPASHLGVN